MSVSSILAMASASSQPTSAVRSTWGNGGVKYRPQPDYDDYIVSPHPNAQVRRPAQASAAVMAITKCRIWVPPVNRLTGAATALRQCGRTSDGWSTLLEWRRS